MNKKNLIFISILIIFFSIKLSMVIESKNIYSDNNWPYSTVYLIPSTHSDPYWKGEWAGPNMYTLMDNLLDALLYIKINPDFKYTIDQASIILAFMEEYPEYKDDLIKAVNEGKIEIVGGGVSQSDLNIPSGEGLIRNFLEGYKIIKQYFNVNISVAWQVDTFGAPGSFPTILAAMDYRYLYYMRDSRGRPEGAFWWVGGDGSRILCWKTRYGRYPLSAADLIAMINYEIQQPMAKLLPSGNIMLHIGGDKARPLTWLMDYIQTWNSFYAEKAKYRIKVATPSEFFESIKNEAYVLPEYGFGEDNNPYNEGEYLSYIETKVYSRLWENYATIAEIFGTLGRNILNQTRINELNEINQGWWLNSFLYHHDTVTGTSPYSIASNFLEDYRIQANRANYVLSKTVSSFAKEIKIDNNLYNDSDGFLVLFNSEGTKRTEILSANIILDPNKFSEYEEGNFNWSKLGVNMTNLWTNMQVPIEIMKIDEINNSHLKNISISFLAEVPSVGYAVFAYNFTYNQLNLINSNEKIMIENTSDTITAYNGVYNITWDLKKGGNIISLFKNGYQLVRPENPIGFSYADSSNEPYDLKIYDELDNSLNHEADYNLQIGGLKSILTLNIPMELYNLSVTYEIMLNSSLIPVSISYKFLEDEKPQNCLANILMMNFGWNDNILKWINGEPYGWTDHSNDKYSKKVFPSSYWSIIENSSIGLAVYDRGILSRYLDPYKNQFSILLVHQNDPINHLNNGKLSIDTRAQYEKYDFFYDEIEQFKLNLAFEYYENNWSIANVPNKARNFNHPIYIVGLNNKFLFNISTSEFYIGNNIIVKNHPDAKLPEWGSFFECNKSNIVFNALKKGDFENGIIFRLFTYPYESIDENVGISFLKNLESLSITSINKLKLVTALEKPFLNKTQNPDPSIPHIPSVINTSNFSFNISKTLLKERIPRTFMIPIENQDVKSPIIYWNFPIFGILGFPVQLEFKVVDSSQITFYGEYSEDSGQSWKIIKEYSIEKINENEFIIKAIINPNMKCKLRIRVIINDIFNNTNGLGYFETYFAHLNTDYSDKSYTFPNSPQIRITWPVWLIIIISIFIIYPIYKILKIRNRDMQNANSEVSLINKLKNRIDLMFKLIPNNLRYLIIGFLILFELSFLQQSIFVFDYTDLTDIILLDEYILDNIQFFRKNFFYIPIYFITEFIILIFITSLNYKKYKKITPMYFGFLFIPIPLITNVIQMNLYMIYNGLNSLPASFVWNEIFHLYINPFILITHLITVFGGFYLPRLFIKDRTFISSKTLSKVIQKWYKITLFLTQITILAYYSALIFVDYHTRFLGGMVFGELSRGQAYVIYGYFAFLIVFFFVYSAIASIIFELIPDKYKNAKKPLELKTRYLIIFISLLVGLIGGWIYYIERVQYMDGIISMSLELYILYLPSILFSENTIFLSVVFIALPHIVIFLIFYPIKFGIRRVANSIKFKLNKKQ